MVLHQRELAQPGCLTDPPQFIRNVPMVAGELQR